MQKRLKQKKGNVVVDDIPEIIFGEKYNFKDSTSIELPDAFEHTFTKKNIQSAKEKCCYRPPNCHALLNPKCHREIGDEAKFTNE